MTTFKPEGIRALNAELTDCADAVTRPSTTVAQLTLRSWQREPTQSYEHFRLAWAQQLQAMAAELRQLARFTGSVAAALDETDQAFGSALGD